MTAPWEPQEGRVVVALVRHGRTAWNAERRFLGRTDIPLDPCGEAQARALGASCPTRFERVYSSPLSRAFATARALDPGPVVIPDLTEMAQGDLEGKGRAELFGEHAAFLERWLVDSVETTPPGGESLLATRDRALPALRDVVGRHAPGERIAVVSHQMVIASLTCTFIGEPLENWRAHGIPNAAITWLTWDGERFDVVARAWRHPDVAAVEET